MVLMCFLCLEDNGTDKTYEQGNKRQGSCYNTYRSKSDHVVYDYLKRKNEKRNKKIETNLVIDEWKT